MTYRGRIRNGSVVLEEGASLPEGTEVLVQPVRPVGRGEAADNRTGGGNTAAATSPAPTPGADDVWLKLLELSGTAQGLPADLPERHDQYRRRRLDR